VRSFDKLLLIPKSIEVTVKTKRTKVFGDHDTVIHTWLIALTLTAVKVGKRFARWHASYIE